MRIHTEELAMHWNSEWIPPLATATLIYGQQQIQKKQNLLKVAFLGLMGRNNKMKRFRAFSRMLKYERVLKHTEWLI